MKGIDDALTIREDDLSGREIAELLSYHLNAAIENSPEGAVHALHLRTWMPWSERPLGKGRGQGRSMPWRYLPALNCTHHRLACKACFVKNYPC